MALNLAVSVFLDKVTAKNEFKFGGKCVFR
jgi:hypothetical protein